MKPTWQLTVNICHTQFSTSAITIPKTQMWNHLSRLFFLLVGCPESHPEEPITACVLTAHLVSGLLRYASLSVPQIREEGAWKTTNLLFHLQKVFSFTSHQICNKYSIYLMNPITNQPQSPSCEKTQGKPNGHVVSLGIMFWCWPWECTCTSSKQTIWFYRVTWERIGRCY